MECAAPDTGGMGKGFALSDPNDVVGAPDHFFGGPARESEQHDAAWVDARTDQVSDVVGESLSFARPGSGDNEDRPSASFRRRLLLWIQVIQPGKFGWNTFVKIGHKDSIAE